MAKRKNLESEYFMRPILTVTMAKTRIYYIVNVRRNRKHEAEKLSKTRNIVTWSLTVILALIFVSAGYSKVSGQEMMVQSFILFGLPDWFRLTIGTLEILGGVLLLVPAFTGTSAFGLSIIMIGAVASHAMFTPLEGAIPAASIFLVLTYIYWTRKAVVPHFLQKTMVG